LPNDDRYYRSAVELVGAVPAALDGLRAQAKPKDTYDAARFRYDFRRFVRPSRPGLTSQDVLGALRAALPEDALLTCDVGFNKSVSIQCWPAYAPRTFFVSNGLS